MSTTECHEASNQERRQAAAKAHLTADVVTGGRYSKQHLVLGNSLSATTRNGNHDSSIYHRILQPFDHYSHCGLLKYHSRRLLFLLLLLALIIMYNLFLYFIPALAVVGKVRASSSELQIIPGETWTASNYGRHMQAHGGGIIKVDNTYYLIGEDKTNGTFFHNINCFSSTNLVEWNYEGALLSKSDSGDLGNERIVERPKVIYNKSTKKYVLYAHIDDRNYWEAKVGVATSDKVCGKYTYHGSYRPKEHESRDITLFQDDDGAAYLMSEDRPNGLRIYKLAEDYLSVTEIVYTWNENIESPALIKRDGVYFAFGSHLTGWSTNDNVYATAPSVSGPWTPWKLFAPPGANTYNSQTNYILPVSGDLVMYMGDRWHENNLMRSTYVWLPLRFSGEDGLNVTMNYHDHWILNKDEGVWRHGQDEEHYQGQHATLSNGAKVLTCSGCESQKSAGYIGGPSHGEAHFNNIRAKGAGKRMMRIFSPNGDQTERFAGVCVNGGKPIRVAFLPTDDASTPGISGVIVDLQDGLNAIRIEGIGDAWGPDIDRLMIPIAL